MIKRFSDLKETVKKAIPHLSGESIEFVDSEFVALENIVNSLFPILVVAETICARDSNLLKADCAFTFCLKNIDQSTKFGEELYQAVLARILERRTKLSAILQELHDGEKVEVDSHFIKATKKQVIDFVHKLVLQIEQECHEETDILLVDSDEQSVTSVDLKSQLLTMMGKLNAPKSLKITPTSREKIEVEWTLF